MSQTKVTMFTMYEIVRLFCHRRDREGQRERENERKEKDSRGVNYPTTNRTETAYPRIIEFLYERRLVIRSAHALSFTSNNHGVWTMDSIEWSLLF